MILDSNNKKTFVKLMAKKVKEILLISSAYDAFIMEEDGRLTERIIYEYKGLNLSNPPVITWAETAKKAFYELKNKKFDIIITMPRITDMNPFKLIEKIKEDFPKIPIFMLAHDSGQFFLHTEAEIKNFVTKTFVWRGNTDLLLALIKNTEDKMNVDFDCDIANVKVIIFVEDSPFYRSSILPMLYKEIVLQTQAVIEDAMTSEEKLLRIRSRPKILLADNFEEAFFLYKKYKKHLLGIVTDIRFPKAGKENKTAGFSLISKIKEEEQNLEVLFLSTEDDNEKKAKEMSAVFINKNSERLYADIRYFFMNNLGFGNFIFKDKDKIIGRAQNFLMLYTLLPSIPSEVILNHIKNRDFTKWLFARYEIALANEVEKLTKICPTKDIKKELIKIIKSKFEKRQKETTIIDFKGERFNIDIGYAKVGKGSLGGKARGLAFILSLLEKENFFKQEFPNIEVKVPKSMVLTTEGFIRFLDKNKLTYSTFEGKSDEEINELFLNCKLPNFLSAPLRNFLKNVKRPVAVRSSSFLEDAHFRPCAGIYKTYMLPNINENFEIRKQELKNAIKLVYASIFLKIPQSFFKNTQYNKEEDKMAVLIQELCGDYYDNYFYPLISGVAQSHNFYPNDYMKKEEGLVHIAMGFGKTIVEGERSLKFSPAKPTKLPQFSNTDDILKNAQRFFYALNIKDVEKKKQTEMEIESCLEKLEVEEAKEHGTLEKIASSLNVQDNRIRNVYKKDMWPVLTFSNILTNQKESIPSFLKKILSVGEKGMGTPVEMEFAIDIKKEKTVFYILQIRPMVVHNQNINISITQKEKENALCFSNMAMGISQEKEITNIIYVDEKKFDISKSLEITKEISFLNATLKKENEKYVLIGPGRWGSLDRWLGIPVTWNDISEVDTIIETKVESLNVEPSQGSHFFHNITSLNVNYISIINKESFIKVDLLDEMDFSTKEMKFVKHIRLKKPLFLKIDGQETEAIIIKDSKTNINASCS